MSNGRVYYDRDPVTDDQYSEGTRARYRCNDGFVKKDNAYGFCQSWGQWHYTRFTCLGM